MTEQEFFDRPLPERQLIAFADDETVNEREKAAKEGGAKDVIEVVSDFVIDVVFQTYAYRWAKARTENALGALLVPNSLIPVLTLPPGHPRYNTLYVVHPANEKCYVPVAEFHRKICEHKFSELISIMKHLGAKHVQAEHISGWDHRFVGTISVDAGISTAGAGGSHERHTASSANIIYEAEFDGHDHPALPENLVWYPHEPLWQNQVDGRLKFGLKELTLNFDYQSDYGVNDRLKAKAETVGIELGGEFVKHVNTRWLVRATF